MRLTAVVLLLHAAVALAGERWTALTPFETHLGSVALAGDPVNPNTLYADNYPAAGIVKSTDGGATWTATPFRASFKNSFLRNIVVDAAGRVTALSWDDPNVSVYRSFDGGMSWTTHRFTPVITGLILDLVADPANPNVLYAAHPHVCAFGCVADSGGVSQSTDGGGHWTALFKGFGIEQLAIDPFGSGTVYAAGQTTSWRLDNGGQTRTKIELPGGDRIFRLALDPVVPDVVYASSYYGFWRSDDRGDTWHQLSSTQYDPAWTIAIDPTRRDTIVIGGGSGWGVRRSTDGGRTWTPLNDGLTGAPLAPSQLASIRVFFAPNGQLYGAADLFGAMTLRSTNDRRQRAIRH